MAVPDRNNMPEKTNQTEQYVLNYSFDEIYKILMVGLAGYNPTTGNYDRIQIDNATGGIKTTTSGLTNTELRATAVPISSTTLATSAKQDTMITDLDYRFSGGKSAYSTTIAASGNTNLITPASGNRIQLYWLSFIPSSDNANANLLKVGFGTTGGSISTELYRATVVSHWEVFTGTANQSLIINTATAEAVHGTVHYKEIA